MEIQEAEDRKMWYFAGHVWKISYCNSLITQVYNKYPTLDQIETSFYHCNQDGTFNYKMVDSTALGIYQGSLCDYFNFCYGDPSDPGCRWRNPHEREVVEIMGKLVGMPDTSGYLTSGGSEANLSGLWWCKLWLRQQSRPKIKETKDRLLEIKQSEEEKNCFKEKFELKAILKRQMRPTVIMTKPPHTHQTVIKATQVLELKTLYIEANEDGSMSLDSLRNRLSELKHKSHMNLIVNVNFGTHFGAAFDDVVEIRKVLDDVKNEDWKYTVHMDAVFYGPTLPILKQFGEKINLKELGVDTVSIGLWKFLGVQVPCGVALSSRDFTNNAFDDNNFVEYVQMQDKVALVGTRSGIAASSALNVLRSLKLHQDTKYLENIVNYSLEMAQYLEEKLNTLYLPGEVKRRYLNVNFPRKNISYSISSKYLLMNNGENEIQAIGLLCVTKGLIDAFIADITPILKGVEPNIQ